MLVRFRERSSGFVVALKAIEKAVVREEGI
jgi:hypothetical protein